MPLYFGGVPASWGGAPGAAPHRADGGGGGAAPAALVASDGLRGAHGDGAAVMAAPRASDAGTGLAAAQDDTPAAPAVGGEEAWAAEREALVAADRLLSEAGGSPLGQAEAVVAWIDARYRPGVVLACSFGAEDCVLVDMISRVAPAVGVFYLDTELLFPETYRTRDRLVARYGIRPVQVLPLLRVEEQAAAHGPALWERAPDLCCRMRKVEPLTRFLSTQRAWITGIRREQSPTRAAARLLEWDGGFGLAKGNPLAAWTHRDVWQYVQDRDVPYNPLHDQGYPSIGCWPCTRAVRAGEDARAGRWSGFAKTECGLHG